MSIGGPHPLASKKILQATSKSYLDEANWPFVEIVLRGPYLALCQSGYKRPEGPAETDLWVWNWQTGAEVFVRVTEHLASYSSSDQYRTNSIEASNLDRRLLSSMTRPSVSSSATTA